MKPAEKLRKLAQEMEEKLATDELMPSGICSLLWVDDEDVKIKNRIREHLRGHRARIVSDFAREMGATKRDINMCFAYPIGEDWEARILAMYWMAEEFDEE